MTYPRRRSALAVTAATTATLTAALGLTACGSDSDSGKAEGGTHVVKTYKGDVKVPDNPERVVVLDTAELDSAITLGVKPVGATKADVGTDFLGYLPDSKVKGIENVGNIAQPNLEKIAALDPDLILTNGSRDEKNYDKLKEIAPTVMTETTGLPWKENFKVHADALGKKEEARKVVAAYDKHAGEVTEALGGAERAKSLKTNVIRFVEGADLRIYGDGSYIGTVLEDAGLGRPPIVDKATELDGLMLEVSPEQVDKVDTDVLFYTSYGDQSKSGESKATDNGLWKNMKAVKNGTAHRVNDELWIQGIGYTAANKILDEMAKLLAK
ncbi:iron-siderophore ABC transporter substrate-binding protein [Streptomyces armeniacus]|uniref:Iron-siderophore ABC transporter substrate-binding protein n=1 Tax=Streptomyces armeniacus TaxID=83291 RepID=A0A345XL00_9ACTN|nr:iron-siderophore ABC transporter substrate-binding protein [Streptomyces armeniacus]AXK32316.1 iron-siderophore ABC transporter substrate-binding protein [Streptomyces armeniacus]